MHVTSQQLLRQLSGNYVEYCTALVSMPYTDSFSIPELPKAQALAERVGWHYVELADWSRYAAHSTPLLFFRRTTTHEEMLRTWSMSFKRCLIENKSRVLKGVNCDRRHASEGAIACEHLPLDVRSWGYLRERYLKEFAPSMYHFEKIPMARALTSK